MKKIIGLSLCISVLALGSFAQNPVSFGLRGGINFQNINGDDRNGDKLENDILTAFHVGVNVEFPIAAGFYLQPGLLYSGKGAKSKDVIAGQTINGTIRIGYLELPVNFIYKPVVGKGHLLLGFGPYVGFGIGGTAKYEVGGSSIEEDIKFQKTEKTSDPSDVVYIKPFDAGANFLFGYEWKNHLSFQLNAQLGLVKINPEYEGASNDKSTAKNTGFGVSVGYRF